MEELNNLWHIVPKSQETIGVFRVTVEGGLQHHRRLEIEVEVKGARASIEDEEAQCVKENISPYTYSTSTSIFYEGSWGSGCS